MIDFLFVTSNFYPALPLILRVMLDVVSDSNTDRNSLSITNLPAEIINKILLEIQLESSDKTTSLNLLLPLLSVHRSLTPFLRRILFNTVTIGSINSKEKLLIECLEGERDLGKNIFNLNIYQVEFERKYYIPSSVQEPRYLNQLSYEDDIATILVFAANLLRLVINTNLCTSQVKNPSILSQYDQPLDLNLAQSSKEQASKLKFDKVERALRLMSDLQELTIDSFQNSGVIEILGNQISYAPYLIPLSLWHNLTALTLSSLYLSLPANLPSPRYHLKHLHLRKINFDSIHSFKWLAGIGRIEAPDFVSLESLTLIDLEFDSYPLSSGPLLSLFTPTSTIFNTLTLLHLHLKYPITDDWNTPFSSSLFTNFIRLKVLHLSGPGVTRNFITSLLPLIASPNMIRPSSTLTTIKLQGTTRLSLAFLYNFFHQSTITSDSNWSNLESLEFITTKWNLIPRKDWKDILKWGKFIPASSNSGKKGLVSILRDSKVVEGDDDSDSEEEDAWWEDEDDDMDPYVSEREINRGRRY